MYAFFLGETQLPVAPSKLQTKIKGHNKTLTLINEGDMNFLRMPGLTEVSFEAMLPMLGRYSFASDYRRPDYYLAILEDLMVKRKPFQFIVSRMAPSGGLLYYTNMKVSLESYNVTEAAKDGLDVTVAINLKQYIEYATKTVTVVKPEAKTAPVVTEEKPRETSSAPSAKTYTVVKGDCLWAIAKKFYGNGADYPKIAKANNIPNSNIIYAGQVLTIP